jgi:hypothetical protein
MTDSASCSKNVQKVILLQKSNETGDLHSPSGDVRRVTAPGGPLNGARTVDGRDEYQTKRAGGRPAASDSDQLEGDL